MRPRVPLLAVLLVGACHSSAAAPAAKPVSAASNFLFLWAADADKQESDFLAVIDVDPRSPTYATVVKTVPVGAKGTRPHHTEYQMPADGILWANGFDAGQTYLFDLRDPTHPGLLTSFGDVGPMSHPHSYSRLSNGHILATFQHGSGRDRRPGRVRLGGPCRPYSGRRGTHDRFDRTALQSGRPSSP